MKLDQSRNTLLNFIKKMLYRFDPETAHHLFLTLLKISHRLELTKLLVGNIALKELVSDPALGAPIKIMGLTFPNKIGLAAGLDKNGECIDALSAFGFGFIEIGTVTLKAQSGNPKPRLFRYTAQQAIVNRLGFNSKGVNYVIAQLKKIKYKGVLGINIGKNRDTPLKDAADEYATLFKLVAPYASYIAINISSPNTPQLRELQSKTYLQALLQKLKNTQHEIQQASQQHIPLVVKISPDLNDDELQTMCDVFLEEKIDGVIATNSTTQHAYTGQGGLSGEPLGPISTAVIQKLSKLLKDQIPIIGCGGIVDLASAKEKIKAGSALIEIYSYLIF